MQNETNQGKKINPAVYIVGPIYKNVKDIIKTSL